MRMCVSLCMCEYVIPLLLAPILLALSDTIYAKSCITRLTVATDRHTFTLSIKKRHFVAPPFSFSRTDVPIESDQYLANEAFQRSSSSSADNT